MKKKNTSNLNPLIEKYQNKKVWVNYSLVKVPGRNTTTKIPFSPITKRKASSTDQATWGTYKEALSNNPEAIGIVFTPEQLLLGIDIDHCLEKGTTNITHEEKEKIADLIIASNTYTEISPSGTGLHLYFELTVPLTLVANRHENFEAYTSGRYFTVTKNSYKEEKPVRTITTDEALTLLKIIGYPWGKENKDKIASNGKEKITLFDKDHTKIQKESPTVSKDLLTRIFRSKNGSAIKALHDATPHALSLHSNDLSKADMALLSHLAFWTQKNPQLMESLWLSSPLGSREKTQKRQDYRTRSITTAISNCKEVYENKNEKMKQEIENNAPDLDLLFTMNKGERIYTQNTENMCRILRHHLLFKDKLQYDIFKNTLEIKDNKSFRSLEDHDILNVQTTISIIFPCFGKVGKEMIYDAIVKVARENTIDSAADYIKSLVWDHTDRLSTWLVNAYNTPDDVYYRAVGSNWLKGLIKRLIEPGCKFDYVLVLEGEQGIKKSTSLGVIGNVYPDQPSWHVETTMSPDNKDFFMQFQGKAIVEFSEGETLSRTEVKKMKAIITTQSDKYRPAYGRTSVDFPRRCVFAMTTNQSEYLKDETGNRRWLPVACEGQANIDWLKENRDQLFAEAYYRLTELNETTWEFPEEETHAMQSERRIHSPNEDLIADWYFNKLNVFTRDEGITIHQVYREALHGNMPTKSLNKYDEMEIANVLKDGLKLEKRRKMIGGMQNNRWFLGEKSVQSFDGMPKTDLEKVVEDFRGSNKELF